MTALSRDRVALLIQVAQLYYESGLTQDQIAETVGFSRPTVSRLLDEARLTGIVRIQIGHPLERFIRLEQDLSERFPGVRFHIAEDHVVGRGSPPTTRLAAEILGRDMGGYESVGISSGTTLAAVVDEAAHLPEMPARSFTFVQLLGSVAPGSQAVDGPDLCRRFAAVFGGRVHPLPAPLVARDSSAAVLFREDRTIAEALERGRRVDLAVVGIGRFQVRHARDDILYGWTDLTTRREVARHGAVCHMLGQFVDQDGRALDAEVNRRVIGMTLDELRNVPRVVAVAHGGEKAPAILAALKGGFLDDLVVDYSTAARVLGLSRGPVS